MVVAELLPGIEAVMVAKLNEEIAADGKAEAFSPELSRSA